ncbi:hypothetical protein QZM22_30685 [Burkholderia oklahomensis]|nr:hypothetical protein [Burkholderia oklahomensis]MDN7676727.1 hypothetical protein [Burkholderia oklahomensis]
MIIRMGRAMILAGLVPNLVTACTTTGSVPPSTVDIGARRHPLLATTQQHIRNAWDLTVRAQGVNNDQLGGHAENAKRLLDQAAEELKAAALAANDGSF